MGIIDDTLADLGDTPTDPAPPPHTHNTKSISISWAVGVGVVWEIWLNAVLAPA